MRLLLVAPPGAGKGTQAARLSRHYGIAHLSSGELFRREVAAGTDVGRLAAGYLARGDLVPDGVVLEILGPAILEAAAAGGFVLDGWPRTLAQAEEAYAQARQLSGVELQAVIHLEVKREELLRRLTARAQTDGRIDDTPEVIAHRIEVYDRLTEPMLGFYAGRGLVIDIEGERPPAEVTASIIEAVDGIRADLA